MKSAWQRDADEATSAAEAQWEAQSAMQASEQAASAGAPWTNTFSPTKPMATLANPPSFSYVTTPADCAPRTYACREERDTRKGAASVQRSGVWHRSARLLLPL